MPTRPDLSVPAPPPTAADATAPLLAITDLKVHFALRGSFLQRLFGHETASVRAVDGVSLSLRRGEVLGLVGESGSGKTTLGKAVLGLVKATGGSIVLDGQKITALSEREIRPLRRRVQPVFQDPHASLNPAMTIEQAIVHPLQIHNVGASATERRALVIDALERVGLVPPERYLGKYPRELSGGQRQRAAIARAIILRPQVIVADEPVSMLDMSVRAKVLQLLVDLKRDLGLTYLYVTHDLATARFFCDQIAIMYLGRIVEMGPADEIYAHPRHPYTRSLLAAIPDPDPARAGGRTLPRGEVPDAAVPPLGCAFHPRCPDAFGPCGWERRDLRSLFEERWSALGPEEYARERAVLGDLSALDTPGLEAVLHPGSGHSPADVATLVAKHRSADASEPLWRGVERVEEVPAGVRVRFAPSREPELHVVGDAKSVVACHLYTAGHVPPPDPS